MKPIQGDALAANLGDQSAAVRDFDQAERLMSRAFALAPADAGLLSDAAAPHRRRSDFSVQNDDRDTAVAPAVQSVALIPMPAPSTAGARLIRARWMLNVDQDAALAQFEKARQNTLRTPPPAECRGARLA